MLLDIAMPGRDGVEILVEITRRWPGLPVVMMSGHGTVETAVRTTRHGAYDFIEKPLSIDKVLLTIQHALEQSRLERENRNLRAQALRAHEILGDSSAVAKAEGADRGGGAHQRLGADPRRERHRQGARRAPDPLPEPARERRPSSRSTARRSRRS